MIRQIKYGKKIYIFPAGKDKTYWVYKVCLLGMSVFRDEDFDYRNGIAGIVNKEESLHKKVAKIQANILELYCENVKVAPLCELIIDIKEVTNAD